MQFELCDAVRVMRCSSSYAMQLKVGKVRVMRYNYQLCELELSDATKSCSSSSYAMQFLVVRVRVMRCNSQLCEFELCDLVAIELFPNSRAQGSLNSSPGKLRRQSQAVVCRPSIQVTQRISTISSRNAPVSFIIKW